MSSTTIYRSPLLEKGEPLLATPFPKVFTLTESFKIVSKKFSSRPCFRNRNLLKEHQDIDPENPTKSLITLEYEKKINSLTFKEVDKWMDELAWGLYQVNKISKGSLFKSKNIGIYLETSREWIMMSHAAMRQSLAVVTCYANLGLEALIHVVNETEMKCMIVERSFIPTIVQVQNKCKSLELIIIVDRNKIQRKNENLDAIEGSSTLKGITFYNLRQLGKQTMKKYLKDKREGLEKPNGETIAVIMYTSGSTGNPKGVVVPHKSLLSAAGGMASMIGATPNDVYLGYLPLAHILELAAEHGCLFSGATIAYGNPRTLVAKPGGAKYYGDIEIFSPTILAGVPRVFDTIRKGIMAKLGSSTKLWLFQKAYNAKLKSLNGGIFPVSHWNLLIFNKMKAALGGRVRCIVSGGAPLSEETHEFLKVTFGCDVIQGYGLTETCGAGTIQKLGSYVPKNIGFPVPCCEIKLEDVPDMGYTVNDKPCPRGEILIRGHNITNGYYKLPKQTEEVYKNDWFHTGDIGIVHEDGSISIIDRKKNLVKLSNGEYVALESLESLYGNSRFVFPNGICIYGNPEKSFIVALVVMHPQYCKQWAKENNLGNLSLSDLKNNDKLKQAVLKSLSIIAQKDNKKSFEQVGDLILIDEEWTVENGMLTNSMKLKRQDIIKKYKPQIDAMYAKEHLLKSKL